MRLILNRSGLVLTSLKKGAKLGNSSRITSALITYAGCIRTKYAALIHGYITRCAMSLWGVVCSS